MDVQRKAFVSSAGRVIMDIMQSDWEPLSHWELDQRLDRTVEEMIGSDFLARQSAAVLMQMSQREDSMPVPQDRSQSETLPLSEVDPPDAKSASKHLTHVPDAADGNPAVQYVTSLLQSPNTSYSKSRMTGRARLSLSHTVLLSLTLLSKRISYRSVSSRFHLEKGNIHRIFFSFCDRVNALQDQIIRWPTGKEALHLLPFSNWLGRNEDLEEKGLPQVLGVLSETRIPIRLPFGRQDCESEAPEAKKPKDEPHPDSWLNLEMVCNGEGRIVYCNISKGSDRHRASALVERLQQHPEMVPQGTCLIAKAGFPLTGQILTPFSPGRSPQENLYNRSLEAHLRRFDQAVADLKQRFQKLRYLDMGNYERAKTVVLTACILHNSFLDMGDVTKGLIEKDTKEDVEEVQEDAAGIKLRDTVVNLLYSALEAGTH